MSKTSVAWLMPEFGEGSGGVRTILQNVEYLSRDGFECDLYVGDDEPLEIIREKIKNNYGIELSGEIFNGYDLRKKYDVAMATYYATAPIVARADCKHKMYFMQDYEPWFFPMSINYLDAEQSYKYDLKCITIGKWLANKICSDFGRKTRYFNFGADLEVYRPMENVKKEKAICFIFQPEKPRRMVDLGLKALQMVQKKRPEVKIYLYGSGVMVPHNLEAEHLGLITPEECNELYNKCVAGLCLSATNPSRIPFEMMAAGLPVVEVYGENTVYDLPEEGCLLAERSPEAIATALLELLDDSEKQEKMARAGSEFMQEHGLERGFEEFKRAVESYVNGGEEKAVVKKAHKIYKSGPVKAKGDYVEVENDVYFTPVEAVDERSALRKKLSAVKYAVLHG